MILDFGSQYTQLIARRIREFNVFSVVLPCTAPLAEVMALVPKGIILSGGPSSVYDATAPKADAAVLATGAYSYRSYLQQDLDLAMPEPMRRHVQLSGAQRKEVSDYLTLAGDNLKDAKPELDPQGS